jgi:hypothetical protein
MRAYELVLAALLEPLQALCSYILPYRLKAMQPVQALALNVHAALHAAVLTLPLSRPTSMGFAVSSLVASSRASYGSCRVT